MFIWEWKKCFAFRYIKIETSVIFFSHIIFYRILFERFRVQTQYGLSCLKVFFSYFWTTCLFGIHFHFSIFSFIFLTQWMWNAADLTRSCFFSLFMSFCIIIMIGFSFLHVFVFVLTGAKSIKVSWVCSLCCVYCRSTTSWP